MTGDRHRTSAEKRARVGWEFCHSIIDDHTRLAYTEIHPDEQAPTVTAFVAAGARVLRRATASSPNACRPTTPGATSTTAACANCSPTTTSTTAASRPAPRSATGRVERYQQTLAREWAYGQRYRNSDARAAALPIWLNHYNTTRNHSSLSNRPPISRVRNQPRHNS